MISLLVLGTATLAQDPTGRPTTPPKSPSKTPPKTPGKNPAKSTTPPPATVTLTILSDPPESAVFINGNRRGVTSEEGKVQFEKLALGSYVVEVRKEGFMTASQVFNAGTESPTLVFKLQPDLAEAAKQFDALVASGNLLESESPSAWLVYNQVAVKFPNRPEVARMRTVLTAKLTDTVKPVIESSVRQWRQTTREDLARAAAYAEKASQLKGDDKRAQAELAYLRGALALRDFQAGTAANGLTTARSEFEKAIASDSNLAAAQYQLGVVLLSNSDAAAESAFLKTVLLEPGWLVGHIGLGMAYNESKKYKEAIDSFRKAQALDANNVIALSGLGLARVMRGESREGLKDLDRAKQVDPASGLPYLYTGMYLAQSKKSSDWKRAEQEVATAIQKNADKLEFPTSRAEQLLADVRNRKK